MLRRLSVSIFAIGLFVLAFESETFAHVPVLGHRIETRHNYYNGYGRGYYGGYGLGYSGAYVPGYYYGGYAPGYNANGQGFSGGYGIGNNRFSTYGSGPYGYGSGSEYQFPTNYGNGNGSYYNGFGNSGWYRNSYDPVYSPFGFGIYSSYNNGW